MATFDSQVRLRQINKPEVSGYIVDVVSQYLKTTVLTGVDSNTGQLLAVFYPLSGNPSGYATSAQLAAYATQAAINAGDTATLATAASLYYPSTNPSGFISSGGLGSGYLKNGYVANQTDFLLTDPSGSGVIDYKANDHYILGSPYSMVSFYDFRKTANPFISGFDIYTQKINGEEVLSRSAVNLALFNQNAATLQLSNNLQITGETLAALISLGGSGNVDLTDVVTLSTDQTILGNKVFGGDLTCNANGVNYLEFTNGASPKVKARNFYLVSDGTTLFECDKDELTFSLNDVNGYASLDPFGRKGYNNVGAEVINWNSKILSGGWTADSFTVSTGNLFASHQILGPNWWLNESGRFIFGNQSLNQPNIAWNGVNFSIGDGVSNDNFHIGTGGNAYFSKGKAYIDANGNAYFQGTLQAAGGLAAITSGGKFSGDGSLLTNLNGAGNPQFIVYTTGNQTISGNKTFRGGTNFYDADGTLRLALTDNGSTDRLTQIRNAVGTLVLSADVNSSGNSVTNLYDTAGYLRYSAGPTTKIYDGNGFLTSEDRVFYNTSSVAVANFAGLTFADNSANIAIDFGNRVLSGNWSAQSFSLSGSQLASQTWVNNAITGFAAGGSYYPLTGNPSGFITSGQTGAFASIVNLATTGVTLQNQIVTLSGYEAATYYPKTNPSGYVTTGVTGGLASQSWVTGQGYATTSALNTATNGLQIQINSISGVGESGAYPMYGNPSGFIMPYQTGDFASLINLATTGATLQGRVNTLSGNLITSGANLTSSINSLSGTLTGNYYLKSNPSGFITTGQSGAFASVVNLASTGSSLQTQVNSLNGFSGNWDSYSASLRAGMVMDGGGTISFSDNACLKWSNRFLICSHGRGSHFSTYGTFAIDYPLSGVISGVGGASNVVASSTGIPFDIYQSLYYILPIGSTYTTVTGNFRVAGYTQNFIVPENWVFIGNYNWDVGRILKLYDGTMLKLGQSFDTTLGSFDASQLQSGTLSLMRLPTGINASTLSGQNAAFFYPASNPSGFVTSIQAGSYASSGDLTATGSNLQSQITNLSGFGAATYYPKSNPSGYVTSGITGGLASQVWVTSQDYGTKSFSETLVNNFSGTFTTNLAATGARFAIFSGNQQTFTTAIPMGVDSYGIVFPAAFGVAPKIQVTLEITGEQLYGTCIRSRTTTGYYAVFSDTIGENGVVLHTFASIN